MDNNIAEYGIGNWELMCHKPEGCPQTLRAKGYLKITKDHHLIVVGLKDGGVKTLVSVPNPNVARVHDIDHVQIS